MEVGIAYLKVIFPKGHSKEWLNHCFVPELLTNDIKTPLTTLINSINTKFNNELIVLTPFN